MDSSKATALRLDGPHQSPPEEDNTALSEAPPPDQSEGTAEGIVAQTFTRNPEDSTSPGASDPPDAADAVADGEATVHSAPPPPSEEEPSPSADPASGGTVGRPYHNTHQELPLDPPAPLTAAPPPVVASAIPVAAVPVALAAPATVLPRLEERVSRLEVGLAQLQDTQQLEERVAAKVTDHITHELAPAAGTSPTAGLAAIGKRLFSMTTSPHPPRTLSPRPAGSRPGWLLWDMLAEARIILRMYVDPRYRMTWVGRVVPIVMLVCFLGATYVVSLVPILGPLLLKVPIVGDLVLSAVQLLIAYVLFKVLSHEARRYREISPDLPKSLRP